MYSALRYGHFCEKNLADVVIYVVINFWDEFQMCALFYPASSARYESMLNSAFRLSSPRHSAHPIAQLVESPGNSLPP